MFNLGVKGPVRHCSKLLGWLLGCRDLLTLQKLRDVHYDFIFFMVNTHTKSTKSQMTAQEGFFHHDCWCVSYFETLLFLRLLGFEAPKWIGFWWAIDTDTPCTCNARLRILARHPQDDIAILWSVSSRILNQNFIYHKIHPFICVLYVYIRSTPSPARRSWQRIAIWCFYLVQSRAMKNHQNSKSERNFRKQFNPTSQLCVEKLLAWKPCHGNLCAKSFSALEFKVFHYGLFFSGQHGVFSCGWTLVYRSHATWSTCNFTMEERFISPGGPRSLMGSLFMQPNPNHLAFVCWKLQPLVYQWWQA